MGLRSEELAPKRCYIRVGASEASGNLRVVSEPASYNSVRSTNLGRDEHEVRAKMSEAQRSELT